MEKFWKTTRYLVVSLSGMMIIGFVSILINAAVMDVVIYINHQNGLGAAPVFSNMEGTAAVFMFIMGIIYFAIQFEVLVANGVSRKTFFWAILPTFAVLSAAFALFITLVTLFHRLFMPAITVGQVIYKGTGLFSSAILQFATYFLCGVVSWLVYLAYYRSSKLLRWMISLAPFVVLGLWITWRSAGNRMPHSLIGEFFNAVMGLSSRPANPCFGILSLLALAAAACAANYFLLRRAPLKS